MEAKYQDYLKNINFKLPPDIRYLERLTTPTGIIQHAKYAVPDRKLGYTLDDNSRAFVVSVWLNLLFKNQTTLDLALIYLSFISHAKTEEGDFFNFLSFDHRFLDEARSQDCFGRAFWSLGFAAFAGVRRDITLQSSYLAAEVLPNIRYLTYPRAKAYTLLGLAFLSQKEPQNEQFRKSLISLSNDLISLFKKNSFSKWRWFEKGVTYGNAVFPYALLLSYLATKDEEYLKVATESLDFLFEVCTVNGKPSPVGQNGWYCKGKSRALYDQQAIDPAYLVLASSIAYKITKDKIFKEKAIFWFSWFHGNNLKEIPLHDEVTGGCFDGLTSEGVNLNQGAESIICYLLAYLSITEIWE
jgi:hypothetical protein